MAIHGIILFPENYLIWWLNQGLFNEYPLPILPIPPKIEISNTDGVSCFNGKQLIWSVTATSGSSLKIDEHGPICHGSQ
jgi:hypothetical protein